MARERSIRQRQTPRVARDTTSKTARRVVASKRKEIAALDDEFFGEVVGVAQAIGVLRKALGELSASLDRREFEKASAIGYGAVASEFIFLQRTLEERPSIPCDTEYGELIPLQSVVERIHEVVHRALRRNLHDVSEGQHHGFLIPIDLERLQRVVAAAGGNVENAHDWTVVPSSLRRSVERS
jgi:hypothetical protein